MTTIPVAFLIVAAAVLPLAAVAVLTRRPEPRDFAVIIMDGQHILVTNTEPLPSDHVVYRGLTYRRACEIADALNIERRMNAAKEPS